MPAVSRMVVWVTASVVTSLKTISRCSSALNCRYKTRWMRERAYIKTAEILVFPVNARRKQWDFDVQRVEVFVVVLLIDFDYQRRLGLSAFAHRLVFQRHSFRLDGFDEVHE